MTIDSYSCPNCGYAFSDADIVYGYCPACGSTIVVTDKDGNRIKNTDASDLTDIKDANGNILAKAHMPRGFLNVQAQIRKDVSDKVRPNKLLIDSVAVNGDKLFYRSGESFVQIKNGMYNVTSGELKEDLSAKFKAFKEPKAYLSEMASKVTGSYGRVTYEYSRPFPIEDMDNTRAIYLNASIASLRKALNETNGVMLELMDFYFDGVINVYSFQSGTTTKYVTIGTIIKGDEIALSLTGTKNLAEGLKETREITGTISQVTRYMPSGRMFGRRPGIFAIPGAINTLDRVLNSGIVEKLDSMPDKKVSEDDYSLVKDEASDGSNEGFGTRRKEGSKVSYISWGAECLVGMITENRPDAAELDDFESFIKSFQYVGSTKL